MTTAERLDNVFGSVEIRPLAGPWMEVVTFYRADRSAPLQQVRFEISGLANLESVMSVMLDEIEAVLGIYAPLAEVA